MSDHVLHAAHHLVHAVNKVADENLSRKLADAVKTHAALAVGAAFIPIPGADIAAAAANTWTMYIRINHDLGLKFSDNAVKSIASGVATNLGANAAVLLVAGSALKLIPGLGTLGGAVVVGGTIYGVTIVAGIVYMRAIAALANRGNRNFSESDLKSATEQVMSNKGEMQDMIRNAKKDYRPS